MMGGGLRDGTHVYCLCHIPCLACITFQVGEAVHTACWGMHSLLGYMHREMHFVDTRSPMLLALSGS